MKIQEKTKVGEYLVVDDLAGLIALVQMGILEIHTWNALADHLERPDRVVFDLDPDPAVGWERVVEGGAGSARSGSRASASRASSRPPAARACTSSCPLRPASTWEESFAFSRAISEEMERGQPRAYTTAMPKAAAKGKILIDYLRNNRGNTSVAAYSTRARPGAPVSTPITWEELTRGVKPDQFHVANIRERLESLKADPWAEYGNVTQRHHRPRDPAAPRPRMRRRLVVAAAAAPAGVGLDRASAITPRSRSRGRGRATSASPPASFPPGPSTRSPTSRGPRRASHARRRRRASARA